MFIYAGGRRTGKTGKMIEWFLANPMNHIIVTTSVPEANYIIKRIQSSMGKDYPFLSHIMPYSEARTRLVGSRNYQIGVENVDLLLTYLFGNTVEFATLSGVMFEEPRKKSRWKFWK